MFSLSGGGGGCGCKGAIIQASIQTWEPATAVAARGGWGALSHVQLLCRSSNKVTHRTPGRRVKTARRDFPRFFPPASVSSFFCTRVPPRHFIIPPPPHLPTPVNPKCFPNVVQGRIIFFKPASNRIFSLQSLFLQLNLICAPQPVVIQPLRHSS